MKINKLTLFLLLNIFFDISAFGQSRVILAASEINLILNAHNKERELVNSPRIIWDNQLAEYAYKWAENLAQNDNEIWHRTQTEKHYGENISSFFGYDFTANKGVDMWNEEKAHYTYSPIDHISFKYTGHYTQVVWANTRRVGCGCAKSVSGSYFFVCNYDPPGNYVGEYPY